MTDTSGLLALVEQDAARAQSLQAQEGVASKKRRSGRASGAAAVQVSDHARQCSHRSRSHMRGTTLRSAQPL